MRDLRIFVRFLDRSGYESDGGAQGEFRRGAMLGMALWQSVFPDMNVRWVLDQPSSNFIFTVQNYDVVTPPSCAAPGFTACATSTEIFFNSRGRKNFLHDAFTYLSRQALWSSYEPATYPPVGYGDPNLGNGLGWIDGRYKAAPSGDDTAQIVLHEFGHVLGLDHDNVSFLMLAFYGLPHPPNETRSQPNIITPNMGAYVTPPTTGLRASYYGGGTPQAPWVGDLRFGTIPMHPMAVTFESYFGATGPAGVLGPAPEKFNFRFLNDDNYNFIVRQYPKYKDMISYPDTRGLIVLRKPSGARALTSSWKTVGSLAQQTSPVQSDPYYVTNVFNSNQIQKIAIGQNHVLAIQADGSLWSWGQNDKGQLGDGNTVNRYPPKQLSPGPTWISVAAGQKFSFALRSNGTLWAWGDRSLGQIGDGVVSSTPQLVAKQIGGAEWAAIRAGEQHVVALKTDGTVWAWGYNEFGQVGNGSNTNQAEPRQEATGSSAWVAVYAGTVNSIGVREDGTLWTWGWNDWGTLGTGNRTWRNVPTREARSAYDWQIADGGFDFTVGLTRDRKLLRGDGTSTDSSELQRRPRIRCFRSNGSHPLVGLVPPPVTHTERRLNRTAQSGPGVPITPDSLERA